jgi:hypothetical protein
MCSLGEEHGGMLQQTSRHTRLEAATSIQLRIHLQRARVPLQLPLPPLFHPGLRLVVPSATIPTALVLVRDTYV